MLNELFTFPTVNIDGEYEEKKVKNREILGDNKLDDYEMVFGEAEYPYWDFIGIEDRWLPTTESLERALEGKFDACVVRFVHTGQILVPWTRKKFKEKLREFIDAYESENPSQPEKKSEFKIVTLTQEQFKRATDGD